MVRPNQDGSVDSPRTMLRWTKPGLAGERVEVPVPVPSRCVIESRAPSSTTGKTDAMPDDRGRVLCGFVESTVAPGSLIVTDDWSGYAGLGKRGYDKTFSMFPILEEESKAGSTIVDQERIRRILDSQAFSDFGEINVLPLIYDEKSKRCNILVFDYGLARKSIIRIVREESGRGRKHPVYKFYGASGDYICEVRYGDAAANALQRGLWTHTKNGRKFFNSITGGWIDYSHNLLLVSLFSHALVSSDVGHEAALKEIKRNILDLKKQAGMD